MRIIINQPRASYFVGGAEMISMQHARYFCEHGDSVVYVTIDPASIGYCLSQQYFDFKNTYNNVVNFVELDQDPSISDIYNIKPGESRLRWNVESLFFNRSLIKYLNQVGYSDCCVLSYYILDCLYPGPHKNVLYLCGTPRQEDDFQGSFLRLYDKVVAISDNVSEYWNTYSPCKIPIVYPGVDTARFRPYSRSIRQKGAIKKIRILYVGRLIARKNVGSLINAVNIVNDRLALSNRGIRAYLTVVGDGPELANLRSIPCRYVRFVGECSNTEQFYANSDIFVSPSSYGEGVQGSLLEAMSTGLVCIASDTAVNRELLNHGRGVVLSGVDASSVFDAIEDVCCNISQYNPIDTRKYICDNYSWNKSVSLLRKEILL